MKKNSYILYTAFIMLAAVVSGCNKVLDKTNLTAVNPSDVWSNATIAKAYLDNIYANMMPGASSGDGNGTDEGVAYQKQTNGWFRGTATYDSYDIYKDTYTNIRAVNILLDNIDNATFDETSKSYIKGQGLFWRAWGYYNLTKSYGGVPLILSAQGVTTNLEDLQVARSKTSECVTQIIKDLDDAIALLPDTWSGEDVGRIDKGAAMAFKGRVLLFFASPLFNPSNDQSKWQQAYDANIAAKNFLDGVGKGLFTPYNKIWDNELNKEVVMVKRYNYPQATYFQGGLIPLDFSKDDVGYDRPSLELADAFPMKDGSAWKDITRSYDTLFRNRDDRFYETIYYNGSPYQYLQGMKDANTYLWTYFDEVTDYNSPTGIVGTHNQITPDPLWSNSSFYRIKGVDKTIVKGTVYNAGVDWVEIRYAEVLMNYGEAANELNKTQEALDVLHSIRNRAGILPGGAGSYGITASTKDDVRKAYQNERFVEFAFERKRLDDLRRWKMFDYLRGLPQRHGIGIVLKTGQTDVSPKDDINTVWTKFSTTVIPTEFSDIAIKDQYYIYGIPLQYINRNPKLLQNNNWDGTFDPLQ
jgi:hypothetical protein